MAPHLSPGDNHQSTGGRCERIMGQLIKMAAWNSFSNIYAPGLSTHSYLSRSLQCHSSVVQGHLHTIHPAWPRSTSYSSSTYLSHQHPSGHTVLIILSTCPNHLNSLWSALLANSISIPALLRTYSFRTLSILDTPTKLLKYFISRTFTFLLSALLQGLLACSVAYEFGLLGTGLSWFR